jgi:hypothetical protein
LTKEQHVIAHSLREEGIPQGRYQSMWKAQTYPANRLTNKVGDEHGEANQKRRDCAMTLRVDCT